MNQFVTLKKRVCPKCRRTVGMMLTKEQYEEWEHYVCYGGFIQDVMPSFDAFGREFIKTGYCPDCQEKIFRRKSADRAPYIYFEEIREDIYSALKEDFKDYSFTKTIRSEAFLTWSVPEKLVYICESDMDDLFKLDADGNIVSLS